MWKLIAGLNIQTRHQILLEADIGVFPSEEESYQTANLLMWVMPLITSISSIIELGLLEVFQHFFHLWRNVLNKEMLESDIEMKEDMGENEVDVVNEANTDKCKQNRD